MLKNGDCMRNLGGLCSPVTAKTLCSFCHRRCHFSLKLFLSDSHLIQIYAYTLKSSWVIWWVFFIYCCRDNCMRIFRLKFWIKCYFSQNKLRLDAAKGIWVTCWGRAQIHKMRLRSNEEELGWLCKQYLQAFLQAVGFSAFWNSGFLVPFLIANLGW